MPNLSMHLQLPALPNTADAEVRAWAESLTRVLDYSWQGMIYVLNALLTVDTLANRPATPEIDQILFMASDTGELFAAVDGAWVAVGGGGTAGWSRILLEAGA